jgi:hypothetical protein
MPNHQQKEKSAADPTVNLALQSSVALTDLSNRFSVLEALESQVKGRDNLNANRHNCQ